jgi:hypothetical protein
MPRFGINQQIPANTPTEVEWLGKNGELVVESTGTTTLERFGRTKYIQLAGASIDGSGSLIFSTSATKLRVTSTATAEVVISLLR